jgi:hypothetical protein
MKKFVLVFGIFIITLMLVKGVTFAFVLLDGALDVKGNVQQTLNLRTHRDSRDVQYSSFRTMFRLEGMYTLVSCPDLDIKAYGLTSYYYDEALDIDANARRAIKNEAGRSYYDNFKHPRDSEEWLKEMYLDIKQKTLQIRLGKQFVSWGETAEARVADLINPLDTKYLIAFPDWEDFKLGLWMARLFYTPENMWQNLAFELVLIPFDFEEQRVPPAGSGLFYGPPPSPGTSMQRLLSKRRLDAPSDSLDNFEAGLRIKGYWALGDGVDWAISHFYTRLDSPLIDGIKGYRRNLRLVLGLPAGGKVYTYPNYSSTAFTFATTVGGWVKSSIRGECVYNTNKDYQYGASSFSSYKIREKDLIATALTISRNTMVPYISNGLFGNVGRSVSITLTWYQYWLLNHVYNRKTNEYIIWDSGTKDSSWTKFTLSLSTGFWFDRIIPLFNLAYDVNGPTTVVAGIVFAPGDHWQWMASYQQVNEVKYGEYQNQVIFSARYEFW